MTLNQYHVISRFYAKLSVRVDSTLYFMEIFIQKLSIDKALQQKVEFTHWTNNRILIYEQVLFRLETGSD